MPWSYNEGSARWDATGKGIEVSNFNIANKYQSKSTRVGVSRLELKPQGNGVTLEIVAPYAADGEKPENLPDARDQFWDRYKDVLKKAGIKIGLNSAITQRVEIGLSETNIGQVAEALENAGLAPKGFAEKARERMAIKDIDTIDRSGSGTLIPTKEIQTFQARLEKSKPQTNPTLSI